MYNQPQVQMLSAATSSQQQSPQPKYEWDPQNLQYFLSIRSKLLQTLFATSLNEGATSATGSVGGGNGNVNGNNNYARSQSARLPMSPTRPTDNTTVNPSLQPAQGMGRSQSVSNVNSPSRGGDSSQFATPTRNTADNNNTTTTNDEEDDSNNEINMALLKELLPLPRDYYSIAVKNLLDTPLPLVDTSAADTEGGDTASQGETPTSTTTQLRQPKENESIYLLSRIYLRVWCHWVRNSIVNTNVERWLSKLITNGGGGALRRYAGVVGGSSCQATNGENGNVRLFLLPSHALQTLAALSILTDQYQLWNGEEGEWIRWFDELKGLWVDWIDRREAIQMHQQQQRGISTTTQKDEKKNDDEANVRQHHNLNQFLPLSPPGPVDLRILSSYGHPLRLRRSVSLTMKGLTRGGGGEVMSVDEEMREECLMKFLSLGMKELPPTDASTGNNNSESAQRLAVCPVSSSFYEMLRSNHGVLCEDRCSISFQRPVVSGDNGGRGDDPTTLLYHDQSSIKTAKSSSPSGSDIFYPSSASSSSPSNASQNVQRKPPSSRPIEFPRRVLISTLPLNKERDDYLELHRPSSTDSAHKMSPYSKLMKEAMSSRHEGQSSAMTQSTKKGCTVEVYPVEFRYVVVDGYMSGSDASCSNLYTAQGIAHASRVSTAGDVFRDLERNVAPNRTSAHVRLWIKSPSTVTPSANRNATQQPGDGYELIDSRPTLFDKKSRNEVPISVEKFLHLDEKSVWNQSAPVVVEILVELRSSPTARWVREPLELANRLQVSLGLRYSLHFMSNYGFDTQLTTLSLLPHEGWGLH